MIVDLDQLARALAGQLSATRDRSPGLGAWMDQKAEELRAELADAGVDVTDPAQARALLAGAHLLWALFPCDAIYVPVATSASAGLLGILGSFMETSR